MFGRTRPPRGGEGGGYGGGRGGGDDRDRRPPPRREGRTWGGNESRDGAPDRAPRPPFGNRGGFDRGGGGAPWRDREGGEDRPRRADRPRFDGGGEGEDMGRPSRPPFQQGPKAAPQQRRVRYQVVTMGEEDTGEELERRLNTLGRDGWRLVAIDESRQYVFMTLE